MLKDKIAKEILIAGYGSSEYGANILHCVMFLKTRNCNDHVVDTLVNVSKTGRQIYCVS